MQSPCRGLEQTEKVVTFFKRDFRNSKDYMDEQRQHFEIMGRQFVWRTSGHEGTHRRDHEPWWRNSTPQFIKTKDQHKKFHGFVMNRVK